ncbi:MAG TPA: dynamin family protein, partial [Steroidobacteraceae bacterium]|nr:dynamin family protein [Steroidobacteraceae bacterium]
MELKTYESAKFALAEVLRALVAKAPRGADAVSRGAPELFARLAEDRFNLLVAGRFSRGKSSLMNALLGVDRLPTGILPLTSVITAVSYGSQEKAWITPDGGRMPYDIPLEKLRDYLTEDGNPGNRRRVSLARIELPVELLRRGFHFVDSPGLGSAIAANTKTTQAFLPQADAVMLVSGFEAPLGAEEDAIVAWVAQARVPLYIVLNKQDTVTREARDQVVQYVQRHVQERWTGPVPQVFPLSARDALVAKLTRDEVGLERSGLPALEAELTRFLLEDKARVLIAGLCERVRQLMDASTMPVSLVGPLRERLESLERHFSGETRRHTGGTASRPTRPFEPDEVVRIAECRLCAEVSRQVFNDLCQYQYELATFAEAGQALAAAQGLCAAHARLYVGLATDHNVCFALTPLFKRLTAVLQEGSASALLATQARCRSCSLQARVEEAV